MRNKLLICIVGIFSSLGFLSLSAQEAKKTKESMGLSKPSVKKELSKTLEYKSSLLRIFKKQQELETGLQISGLKNASDTIHVDIPVSLLLKSNDLAYWKARNINTTSLSKIAKNNKKSKVQVALLSSEQLGILIQDLSEQLDLVRLQLSLL